MIRDYFKVLTINLTERQSSIVEVDGRNEVAGGSGLAAHIFTKYGQMDKPWDDAEQPLIFAQVRFDQFPIILAHRSKLPAI